MGGDYYLMSKVKEYYELGLQGDPLMANNSWAISLALVMKITPFLTSKALTNSLISETGSLAKVIGRLGTIWLEPRLTVAGVAIRFGPD